jgi:hypothetical protein
MLSTFRDAAAFNGNVSTWNVQRVVQMSSLFDGAVAFDQDLASWTNATFDFCLVPLLSSVVSCLPLSRWNVLSSQSNNDDVSHTVCL